MEAFLLVPLTSESDLYNEFILPLIWKSDIGMYQSVLNLNYSLNYDLQNARVKFVFSQSSHSLLLSQLESTIYWRQISFEDGIKDLIEMKKLERMKEHQQQYDFKEEEEKSVGVGVGVVSKMNDVRWRFDFCYDFRNRNQGSQVHGISNNGRRFECHHNHDFFGFLCFSSIIKCGMICNSGIYQIKLKIDKIDNSSPGYGNIVGLTSDNFGDGSIALGQYNGEYDWTLNSFNWIGWSGCDREDDVRLPNGLYCGAGSADSRADNIFRVSGFKYLSRNGRYSKRLPGYGSGDIISLIYNSDLGQLSFKLFRNKNTNTNNTNNNGSSNENIEEVSLLDSYIYNLPRDLTFYWFIGHWRKPMSVTILD